MDISVLVVTYNQASTIARTLDSILSQDFKGEYEIVIGDDCSSDGTREICEEYAGRYPGTIRYVRREKNFGVVANYFDCMEQARGRYIADCAGDDYWVDPCKLQREYDLMEGDPEVAMVLTDWLCEDTETGQLSRAQDNPEVKNARVWQKGEVILPLLRQEVTLHLCSSLYRRDPVISMVESRPDLMIGEEFVYEDLQVFLVSSAAGKIVLLPGVTLHYSVGHDSISHRKDSARRARHSVASMRQTIRLAAAFKEGIEELRPHFSGRIDFTWAHIFKSHEREVRKSLLLFEKETDWHGGMKSRIYRIMTGSDLLWRYALGLRKIFP